MKRSLIAGSKAGRAELVRAFAQGGDAGLRAVADQLGYRARHQAPGLEQPDPIPELEVERHRVDPRPEPTERVRLEPMKFWRLVEVHYREPTETGPRDRLPPLTLEDLKPEKPAPPTPEPWIPWPRLNGLLHESLQAVAPGRRIDMERVTGLWARGENADPLPKLQRRAPGTRPILLIDRSRRLVPFWQDQDLIIGALRKHLGEDGFELMRVGPSPESLVAQAAELARARVVLALSDLGAWASDDWRTAWWTLGRALLGSGIRATALSFCPPSQWDSRVAEPWSACHGAPAMDPDPMAVERLLTLASPAIRLEPALLRALRGLVPAADASTEFAVWWHDGVERVGSVLQWDPAAREHYRRRFLEVNPELRLRVAETLRRLHGHLPRELQVEERLELLLTGAVPEAFAGEKDQLIHFARRLARTVYDSEGVDPGLAAGGGHYVLRLGDRAADALLGDGTLAADFAKAWSVANRSEQDRDLPRALASEILLAGADRPRHWTVSRSGGSIELRTGTGESGSFVGELETLGSRLALAESTDQDFRPMDLGRQTPRLPLPTHDGLVLDGGLRRLVLERFTRPEWASAMGRDRFGLWAAFELDGVEQRLRWIPPGRFLMGSPDSEQGRDEWEGPQHWVTLTSGFWLAETPVTQALWQAVMGDNPSRFKSPRRPVEQVSWEECKDFCGRLNDRSPGLNLHLPTEAQWEYACRAGTRTSTFAGELEILGQNNGPLLHEIAWYGGNSGLDFDLDEGVGSSWSEKQFEFKLAGSRVVGEKARNPWGLFDMLGNVYEWCEDAWGWGKPYDGQDRVDPLSREGPDRVIRGGSWLAFARSVRAAYRFGDMPDSRLADVGFRLARGQG